jgi:hypothetical protein
VLVCGRSDSIARTPASSRLRRKYGDELESRASLGFAKDCCNLFGDGVDGDTTHAGDCGVGFAASDERGHVPLRQRHAARQPQRESEADRIRFFQQRRRSTRRSLSQRASKRRPGIVRFRLALSVVLGPRALSVVAAVALVTLASVRSYACACCDGTSVVNPVGWSSAGDALLLDSDTFAACEHKRALRALGRGDQSYACFVNRGTEQVECPRKANGARAPSKDPRDYAGPPRVVGAGQVRSELRALSSKGYPLRELDVHVFAAGEWTPLWKGALVAVFPLDVAGPAFEGSLDDEAEMLVDVTVLPTPDGKQALLAVANHDTNPGIGHWGTSFVWVDLPESVGAMKGEASRFESPPPHVPAQVRELRFPTPVVPGPGRFAVYDVRGVGTADTIPRTSARFNDRGLAAHRSGDFRKSAYLFAQALSRDGGNPFARYNLACAYARLAMPELAMWHLSLLARSGCPKCAERLSRARTDDDLASLRERPAFRSMVWPDDAGLPAPESASAVATVSASASASDVALPKPGGSTERMRLKASCHCSSVGESTSPDGAPAWILAFAWIARRSLRSAHGVERRRAARRAA